MSTPRNSHNVAADQLDVERNLSTMQQGRQNRTVAAAAGGDIRAVQPMPAGILLTPLDTLRRECCLQRYVNTGQRPQDDASMHRVCMHAYLLGQPATHTLLRRVVDGLQ